VPGQLDNCNTGSPPAARELALDSNELGQVDTCGTHFGGWLRTMTLALAGRRCAHWSLLFQVDSLVGQLAGIALAMHARDVRA
jgi:hypothetical protein